jgi:pseudouridine-5'-phosphate glycosidase
LQEVTTLTLGESRAFPALMCRDSGATAPACLGSPDAIAAVLHAKAQLKIKRYCGLVCAIIGPIHLCGRLVRVPSCAQAWIPEFIAGLKSWF